VKVYLCKIKIWRTLWEKERIKGPSGWASGKKRCIQSVDKKVEWGREADLENFKN